MQNDSEELNPGREEFWNSFYSEDGRLQVKEWENRRSSELRVAGSLMDHYEWFMLYPMYEEPLVESLRRLLRGSLGSAAVSRPLRVLHVGSGNSDLSDHLANSVSELCRENEFSPDKPTLGSMLRKRKEAKSEILNLDVCADLVCHLASRFPHRLYAIGNCCKVSCDADEERVCSSPAAFEDGKTAWYRIGDKETGDAQGKSHAGGSANLQLHGILESSVDFICEKGTLDALMSSFAGEYNPNVAAYASEMLSVLRPGGVLFLISINAQDVVSSYVLAAEDTRNAEKRFQFIMKEAVQLSSDDLKHIRVETLGSHYNCYTFKAVSDEVA